MRLNKFIANNSQYSRRKADALIEEGLVFVNNQKAELGQDIDPTSDTVSVKGAEISPQKEEKVYFALNKPVGYITTRHDEFNRETVMDLLPQIPNLKPAGRLDKDSQGLLVLSNDGNFINKITHPRYECKKKYLVKIEGKITPESIQKLQQGVKIDNKKTAPAQIELISQNRELSTLKITLSEGRNRQIRKMFAIVNHPVKYLQRLQIGNIQLGNLALGKYRKLNPQEINVK